MSNGIRLIVGLGNPGARYQETRHNAGAWFVTALAKASGTPLKITSRFQGQHGLLRDEEVSELHFLLPTTFMNKSGAAITSLLRYYEIPPEAMLIAHDDLDLSTGDVRLKFDGGHGGHNGLRDIMQHLGHGRFYRLRIGIDHPGHSDDVTDYVLSPPSKADRHRIETGLTKAEMLLPDLLAGKFHHVMQTLHTREK